MRENDITRREFGKLGLGAAALAAVTALGTKRSQAASFEAEELIYMPATALLELFRRRQLSPVEVLEAQIAHSARVKPQVNCFAFEYFDEARRAAKASEKRYMRGEARPLEGITTFIMSFTTFLPRVTEES